MKKEIVWYIGSFTLKISIRLIYIMTSSISNNDYNNSNNNKDNFYSKVLSKLIYFNEKGSSRGKDVGILNLRDCHITDAILNDIINEWFIKKGLFNIIKELKYVYTLFFHFKSIKKLKMA